MDQKPGFSKTITPSPFLEDVKDPVSELHDACLKVTGNPPTYFTQRIDHHYEESQLEVYAAIHFGSLPSGIVRAAGRASTEEEGKQLCAIQLLKGLVNKPAEIVSEKTSPLKNPKGAQFVEDSQPKVTICFERPAKSRWIADIHVTSTGSGKSSLEANKMAWRKLLEIAEKELAELQ